jgi:chorismate lyase / 3-hydroxybenzoate synthase
MSRALADPARVGAMLAVDYVDPGRVELAGTGVLAAIGFGSACASEDPRCLTVPLRPHGVAPVELWRVPGPVRCGRAGSLAWSEDGALQFASIEIDEAHAGGIEAAAASAYARLRDCLRERGYPHPLRIWNYLDAITEGEGDDERYRRFCVGRARGLGDIDTGAMPAATAIGRATGCACCRSTGWPRAHRDSPVENPRQVSAYRYPRQYGPQPPSFARAMLPPPARDAVLLSGTASVVGHARSTPDCVQAQLDETFANFDSLLGAARAARAAGRTGPAPGSRLRARRRGRCHAVAGALDARLGGDGATIVLHADVCRRELRSRSTVSTA